MAVAISPWVVRNYALSGAFVPTATVQGVAAQEGQYTCERMPPGRRFQALQREAAARRNEMAAALGLRFKPGYYQYFYSAADEIRFNRALFSGATERYLERPALLARCAAANLLNFWFLGKNGLATSLNVALQLPLLLVSIAGLFLVHRRSGFAAWAPAALFIAYVVGVHAPVIAHARHSVPLVSLLAVFAATALVAGWRRFASARVRRSSANRAHAGRGLAGVRSV
jgi:hypothetical protein